ncbi:hypothetical protein [Longimicrobium sp.]|uniref:hypothetical protein n=1 Tax=Longimicrobium sp. TaxID=2029185 RepID=UPI002E3208B2|nr:hypothetical protein [Longimicrobium sp.]HEX6042043.1 hypothetical protein [Longimicrobium sp.]
MALITCADCGRDVSSLASACVHCGRPMHANAVPNAASAPYAASPQCPLCAAPVVHPATRTGGRAWCERCGAQLIYGTDGALVQALPRGQQMAAARPVTPVVIVNERKSVGLAALLAFFFGPLGMAYATVGGAIAMCFISLFLMVVTMGLGLFITWPISVLWAVHAAQEHNRRVLYRVQV